MKAGRSETRTWTRTTDAHTGSYAERVNVSAYISGDDKLVVLSDTGYCTPTVIPGHQYKVTTWYKSTASVQFLQTFTRDDNWLFTYWMTSPSFPASQTWALASWTTPPMPANVNGLQFGLSIAQTGTLTVDDIGFDDASPTGGTPSDSTAPVTSIACNGTSCQSGYYSSAVRVSLASTDESGGSGVKQVLYTTDGSDPSPLTATVYAGPFDVPATTTVKYRAYDNAGNAEAVKSQVVRIDAAKPSVALTSPLAGASVTGKVTITAAADDTGGSGLASVSFLVDGKVLATDTTAPYSAVWNTKASKRGAHTLTATAADGAGNQQTSSPVTVTVN